MIHVNVRHETGWLEVALEALEVDGCAVVEGVLDESLSVNTFFAVDEFTHDNGGTVLGPATHQRKQRPGDDYLAARGCPRSARPVQ